MSSKIGLAAKLMVFFMCFLFCYIGYTISLLLSIGVFLVFNLLFAIGPALGGAPFVFVYNGCIYEFDESILYWSRKSVSEYVRVEYGYNSFTLLGLNDKSYKIKDFYSYMFPVGFIRKEERRKRLETKLRNAGFRLEEVL